MPRVGKKRGRSASRTGRSVRRRLNFTKRRRPRGGKRMKKIAKSVMFQLAESKHRNLAYTGAVYHNGLHEIQLFNNATPSGLGVITQGNANQQRNGSEIYAVGIMLRGTWEIPWDRRNQLIRVYLVEYNSENGNPTDKTKVFEQTGTRTGNIMLDNFESDNFKFQKIYEGRPYGSKQLKDPNQYQNLYWKKWIPFKRKLCYQDEKTSIKRGMKEAMSLIVFAYDVYATLETDILISRYDLEATLYFKDP